LVKHVADQRGEFFFRGVSARMQAAETVHRYDMWLS
jgi:hypothetical protein